VEIDESELWRFSRRDILALSVSVITAMSFGSALGVGVSHAADIKFREGRCLGKTKKSVLVTYASKYGSTGGVADAIGKELCAKGVNAEVVLIKNARNVGSYQGVVIGSAIYRGKWMSDAMDFVSENQDTLRRMPVAYFLVCMTLARPTQQKRAQASSYMDDIVKAVPKIKPVGVGTFAGALNYSNLSWLNKKIMKSKGSPEGDFRDWNAIRAWAREQLYTRFVR
jgi:menaquinone-dependent protoporphyrinogen oxidase